MASERGGRRGVLAGNPFEAAERLFPQETFKIGGWLAAGYMGNADSPRSRFHGPYNAVDRDELMGNQAYLIFQKELTDEAGFGGRVDLLYGSDYLLAQSRGFEVEPNGDGRWNGTRQYYGFAAPQAYGEFGTKDASVKFGHFYSVVGYEGVTSASNFFYSHAYSYQFAGPFTHWGALASVKSGNLTIDAGAVNGWNALDREDDQANFLGRVRWADEENILGLSFAVVTGNERTLTTDNVDRNRTRYSFIVDVNPTCNLEYVFHHWLGCQDDGKFVPSTVGPGRSSGGTALWYGIDQYVYYRISDQLKAGLRFEWFRDEDGTRVGLNRVQNPNTRPFAGNFYSTTIGVNYTPVGNVIIRPELRYDTQGDGRPAFNDGTKKNQFMAGLDVIVVF
ncbi:MAG: outer membrane beta-barrel protein [Gemmataceae bacterium]